MANQKNILISFLGVGDKERNYKDYNYIIDDVPSDDDTSLIQKALYDHYSKKYGQIDRVVMLGTLTSMWENVYFVYYFDDGFDDEFDKVLEKLCKNETYISEVKMPDCLTKLQNLLSKKINTDVKIELLHYGVTHEQIEANATIIMGLSKYFNDPNTKYNLLVDITHGFRSLPMYVMNLLIYLQNVQDNITIKHITYGMSELSNDKTWKKENGEKSCPVVDLNIPNYGIMDLSKWINGAYAFKEFGKGYKIAELIGNSNLNVKNRLKTFSDVMGADFLTDIKKQVQNLQSIKNEKCNPIADLLIPSVVNDYVKRFQSGSRDSKFQFEVAKWHFEHMNYSSAIIDLLEALITKVKEVCGINDSETAKIILGKRQEDEEVLPTDTLKKYLGEYLRQKKYNTEEQELEKFLEAKYSSLNGMLKIASTETQKKKIRSLLPQINPNGKNAFELVYSINPFRNAIAHQNDLNVFSIDDIIKVTDLCIKLLGKII